TKTGSGDFAIATANGPTLTGGITLQTGTMDFKGNADAGGTNAVTVNGGTLRLLVDAATAFNVASVTVNADAPITPDRHPGTATGIVGTLNALTVGNETLTTTSAGGYTLTVAGTTTLLGNATINTSSGNVGLAGGLTDGGAGFGVTKNSGN